ncbi:MAG TPA: PilN domain-containing protein [Candidatus Saccharimonadales bacterium]|nr:PilN domain-containing protein [Candidatus Saccharimonadales bacterium]
MINLLPPQLKSDYRYARYNHRLFHWIIAFILATAGVVLMAIGGLIAMNNSIDRYNAQLASTQAHLTSQSFADTEKQVAAISNNLKLMVQVLSKEILFSKLLNRLGTITPANVILTNLSISQNQSAIDITAQTTGYNAATQLQVNLADPSNQIFSKADIVSISCATGSTIANPAYPCTATIRAQFTSSNPFLFINSAKSGGIS